MFLFWAVFFSNILHLNARQSTFTGKLDVQPQPEDNIMRLKILWENEEMLATIIFSNSDSILKIGKSYHMKPTQLVLSESKSNLILLYMYILVSIRFSHSKLFTKRQCLDWSKLKAFADDK